VFTEPTKKPQAHDFHGLINFGALHKNNVDNATIIPIIKGMVQCNIASWDSAATVLDCSA
jgi:hypothetical protein